MTPVFMIGTRHSGSNLLHVMLDQWPGIAAPSPPHILQRFMPLVHGYGSLACDENFFRLVEDVCRLVELNPVPWEGVVLDRADVANRCRERSLVAAYGAVYDVCAETKGATTWCCRSVDNIHFVPLIEDYFKEPKYLYLYRDGRDVAVSFCKAVAGEKHFYHIARKWADTQRLALMIRCETPPGRFLPVCYERLTADPAGTARTICAFLGLPYRDPLPVHHRTDEATRAAACGDPWDNVSGPMMAGIGRTFLREASVRDIDIFESVAGHVLDALGYERVCVKRGEEHSFTEGDIRAFNEENAERQEAYRKLVDPAEQMRRELQAGLLKAVWERQTSGTAAEQMNYPAAARHQGIQRAGKDAA